MKFVQNAENQNQKIRPNFFYDRRQAMRSAVRDISVLMKCLMTSSHLRTTNNCGNLIGSIPDTYSRGSTFKTRSGDSQTRQRSFVLFLRPSRKMPW